LLTVGNLLVLLHEITRSAAASTETVLAAVTLEVVGGSDLAPMHHLEGPLKAAEGEGAVAPAGAVAVAVAGHVPVMAETVMGFTVGHAWTPEHETEGREWSAASCSGVLPFAWGLGGHFGWELRMKKIRGRGNKWGDRASRVRKNVEWCNDGKGRPDDQKWR